MALNPGTNRQVPEHSIMDFYNKQAYLGNQFSFAESTAITGTSEQALYLLSNPVVASSSFPSGWYGLFVNHKQFSVATAAQSAAFRVYLNPTVSDVGTPKDPVNVRPASPNTSIAALSAAPTISPNGTLIASIAANAFNSQSNDNLIILDPGQSLLITVQCTASSTVVANLGWYEL